MFAVVYLTKLYHILFIKLSMFNVNVRRGLLNKAILLSVTDTHLSLNLNVICMDTLSLCLSPPPSPPPVSLKKSIYNVSLPTTSFASYFERLIQVYLFDAPPPPPPPTTHPTPPHIGLMCVGMLSLIKLFKPIFSLVSRFHTRRHNRTPFLPMLRKC